VTAPTFVPLVAAPPDADPLDALLREIERLVHADGWDGPNTYHMVERNPLGLAVSGLRPALAALVGYTYPPEAMRTMTAAFTRNLHAVPAGFCGWVITHEGWQISERTDDAAARAWADADAAARRIHLRPDRVEVRNVLVVLVNGAEAMLTRQRGVHGAPDVHTYLTDGGQGLIVDALRELVRVCGAAVTR
jgi:hypothetical protein